jgi:signal transduction histidine kinase
VKRYRSRSLLSVLFVSIASVAVLIYLFMRLIMPDAPDDGVPLDQRFTTAYLIATLRDGGAPLAVFIGLLMATIWIVLERTLAPLRRLSDHARRIGPSNLDERLSTDHAPAELKPLVEAFNTAIDGLEDAWKAQRSFSATAAHELRTPLAALRALVESLLPPGETAEATAELDRLSRIISQLLVLSDGEHGGVRRPVPFDLVDVATQVTMDSAPAFLRSGRQIGLDSAADGLFRVGDPILVAIAVRNLLENALKHTPPGSTVAVAIDLEGVISVDDDGAGLPHDFAARAFDPFTRAHPTGEGAGLGLSIVARIAERHGGRAWLAPGPGARFRLHIPPSPQGAGVLASSIAGFAARPAPDTSGA